MKQKLCLFALFLTYTILPHQNEFDVQFNHAAALYKNGKPEKAIAVYRALLNKNPDNLPARYNLGFILRRTGYAQESIPELEKVIARDPSNNQAHVALAQAYLTVGNLRAGWKELAWRRSTPVADVQKLQTHLKTDGTLMGKTIVLSAEWGLGDTIQFIRYAQRLKNLGATVVAHVQKQLLTLLSRVPFIDTLIGPDQPPPSADYHIPMVSLPNVFETTLETVPCNIPYLQADPQLVKQWEEKLRQDTSTFKIGICWKGNNIHTDEKFMPLQLFMQLSTIAGVQLYSLQRYHGLKQLEQIPTESLVLFDKQFDKQNGSFVDSAAVMQHFDLIITVDTSIAHLAGALGVPVWVILPRIADWRWMLDRTDSPWYPTMRLLRQAKDGQWDNVVSKLMISVKSMLEKKI